MRLVLTPDRWVKARLDTDPESLACFAQLSLAYPDRIIVLLEILDEGAAMRAWFLPGPVATDGGAYVAAEGLTGYRACPAEDCHGRPEVLTVRRLWPHRVPAAVLAAAQPTI